MLRDLLRPVRRRGARRRSTRPPRQAHAALRAVPRGRRGHVPPVEGREVVHGGGAAGDWAAPIQACTDTEFVATDEGHVVRGRHLRLHAVAVRDKCSAPAGTSIRRCPEAPSQPPRAAETL